MASRGLGRTYGDGAVIVRQGEAGDCMYVVQTGCVEVVREHGGGEVLLATLGPEEFFGEMALFTREVRAATVRAKGEAAVLTVDRRTLLARVQKDPSLAFRLIERLSHRLEKADRDYARLRASDRRDWATRPEVWDGPRG